jgi:CBS domain-containing protein
MRIAPAVLAPDAHVSSVLAELEGSPLNAWPVVGQDGLRGMVRKSDIENAAAEGGSNKTVADVLEAIAEHAHAGGESLAHVHIDHSLAMALERMGASGLNVLPVVSRANVQQLMGIVILDDILNTYGVGKRGSPVEAGE